MSDHTDKEFHHLLDGAQKMKWTPGEKILLFAIPLMPILYLPIFLLIRAAK